MNCTNLCTNQPCSAALLTQGEWSDLLLLRSTELYCKFHTLFLQPETTDILEMCNTMKHSAQCWNQENGINHLFRCQSGSLHPVYQKIIRTNLDLSKNLFRLLNISARSYLDVTSSAVQVCKGWFSIRMFSSLLNIGHDVTIISCMEIVTKMKCVNIFQEKCTLLNPVSSSIQRTLKMEDTL